MAAQTTVDIGEMITSSPGIKRGTPHIAGTGVTVRTIVRMYQQGMLPEEIALEYGHLSLAQVHAALAYYHANRKAIEDDIAQQDAEGERLEREHRRVSPAR